VPETPSFHGHRGGWGVATSSAPLAPSPRWTGSGRSSSAGKCRAPEEPDGQPPPRSIILGFVDNIRTSSTPAICRPDAGGPHLARGAARGCPLLITDAIPGHGSPMGAHGPGGSPLRRKPRSSPRPCRLRTTPACAEGRAPAEGFRHLPSAVRAGELTRRTEPGAIACPSGCSAGGGVGGWGHTQPRPSLRAKHPKPALRFGWAAAVVAAFALVTSGTSVSFAAGPSGLPVCGAPSRQDLASDRRLCIRARSRGGAALPAVLASTIHGQLLFFRRRLEAHKELLTAMQSWRHPETREAQRLPALHRRPVRRP